jgi:acyl carrier protein
MVGEATVAAYLKAQQKELLDTYEEQAYPYAKLVEKLLAQRDVKLLSFLDTTFFNLNQPTYPEELFDLQFELFSAPVNFVGGEINLNITVLDERLMVSLNYNQALFDSSTTYEWLGHYRTLWQEMVADPKRPLSEVPPKLVLTSHTDPLNQPAWLKSNASSGRSLPTGLVPNRHNGHNGDNSHQGHFVPPRTATEKKVAAIWRDLLALEEIDIHDNFFELGGHSLLAIQVILRLREAFSITLSESMLFESPTIAKLAWQIEAAMQKGPVGEGQATEPAITPLSRNNNKTFPLSFSQQRLWACDQAGSGAAYNMPAAFKLTGHLDAKALERALNEVVRRHESLRTTFTLTDGEARQVIQSDVSVALLSVPLDHLTGDKQTRGGSQTLGGARSRASVRSLARSHVAYHAAEAF